MKQSTVTSILLLLLAGAPHGRADTKQEIVRLQSDILALQNQIRLLEKTFHEQTEGLRSLVVQLTDQIGKTNMALERVSTVLENQSAGDRSNSDALLQQIRGLTVKVDDASTRISALAQQVSEMKVQSQPITKRLFQSTASDPAAMALASDAIYNEAFNDLVQGNLDMAIEGFSAFIRSFPSSEKADDAQYNIGEAYYNANKIPLAIAAFTRVINDYPSADKVGSAYFKRAKAELILQEKENAIEDFKTVIQKFPDAPEAGLAKLELENLGITPPKPGRSSSRKRD